MLYPTLTASAASREIVEEFRGYNHNLRIGSGEFYDMENLTSDDYPVLSPRHARGVYARPASPNGLIAKEKLGYVNGSSFVYGDTSVDMGLSTLAADNPKELISMGAYVVIFPDKKYINTADLTDYGDIEASYTSTGSVSFSLCTIDGEAIDNVTVSATAPAEPADLQYWIDTSGKPHALKRYTSVTKIWVTVATTYVKISASGIGAAFGQYDGVKISGVTAEGLTDLNANLTIWAKGDDWIVVVGLLDAAVQQTDVITVNRKIPNMDFVLESENRLWGCRYGTALNGETVNEIYACKLGDFRNWNDFRGLSTDSYAASCGTDGAFTGAIAHLGYPLFFKENCVHKVYGSMPSQYQIQTTALRGVQAGCHHSLAIVNETLFYKARSGVCAFDGSFPTEVSAALGSDAYSDAVAAGHGNKYYISMRDSGGSWALFVYDTAKGLWHREDDFHASAFASIRGELYAVDASNRNIIAMLGSGEAAETAVEWMAETGDLGLSSPDNKYLSQIGIRMKAGTDTRIDIYVQYEHDGEWLKLCTVFGMGLRSFTVPIRPRRCDNLRLRLEGVGDAKIYSIVKTIGQGSDKFD